MGIKQLYNDNLRKLPKKYGDVSVMCFHGVNVIFTIALYQLQKLEARVNIKMMFNNLVSEIFYTEHLLSD